MVNKIYVQIQQIFAEVKDASAEIKILPSYRHLDHSTDLCNDFTIVGIPEVQTEEVLSRKMTVKSLINIAYMNKNLNQRVLKIKLNVKLIFVTWIIRINIFFQMICHLFDFLSGHTEIDHPLCEVNIWPVRVEHDIDVIWASTFASHCTIQTISFPEHVTSFVATCRRVTICIRVWLNDQPLLHHLAN